MSDETPTPAPAPTIEDRLAALEKRFGILESDTAAGFDSVGRSLIAHDAALEALKPKAVVPAIVH